MLPEDRLVLSDQYVITYFINGMPPVPVENPADWFDVARRAGVPTDRLRHFMCAELHSNGVTIYPRIAVEPGAVKDYGSDERIEVRKVVTTAPIMQGAERSATSLQGGRHDSATASTAKS